MQCPVCIDEMLVMSERHGVEIDYCPRCRGVWLDRGELDKIIERAGVMPTTAYDVPSPDERRKRKNDEPYTSRSPIDHHTHPMRDRRYDDDRYDRHRRRPYRKNRTKDFLEEIFDIFD